MISLYLNLSLFEIIYARGVTIIKRSVIKKCKDQIFGEICCGRSTFALKNDLLREVSSTES